MATEVTQFGHTVTFASDVSVGTFVMGEPWFLPVDIETFDPASGAALGWEVAHGAMINPFPAYGTQKWQGFGKESASFPGIKVSSSEYLHYDPNMNVAAGVTPGTPLTMVADQSLVVTKSRNLSGIVGPSRIDTLAVFTCVASDPGAGTFRPGYAGNVKDYSVSTSDIQWAKLGSLLALTANVPSLALVTRHVERCWYDAVQGWRAWSIHPFQNCSRWLHGSGSGLNDAGYGRGLNNEWGDCMLSIIASDYSQVEKEDLMHGMIQVGLDMFALAQHSEGTSTGISNSTLTDSTKSWAVNQWAGAVVWSEDSGIGKWARVASNTSDTLTLLDGWQHNMFGSDGGNPGSGQKYRVGCPYGMWQPDGGHNLGRSSMIYFAGWMLDRDDMKSMVEDSTPGWEQPRKGFFFQERNTFNVMETSPGVMNWGSPKCDGGIANAVTPTTLQDTWKTAWTSSDDWDTNEWAGATIECGGSTATVISNNTNTLTHGGWSPSTPSPGEYIVWKDLPGHTYLPEDEGMPEDSYQHVRPSIRRHMFFGISGPLYHAGRTRTDSDGDSRLLEGSASGENANPYRWCCTMNGCAGWILGMMAIPGMAEAYNHPSLFEYARRYYLGFGSYHPNAGGAIIDLASYGGTDEVWHGRGGRPAGSPGAVAYDFWHKDMWLTYGASLPTDLAPGITVVQAKANAANWDRINVTLDSDTVNGNWLIFMAGRVEGAVDSGLFIPSDGWTTVLNQLMTTQAGAAIFCQYRKITANQKSINVPWVLGSSGFENTTCVMLEVSIQNENLVPVDTVVNDLGSPTGTTVPLGSVDGLEGDLAVAFAHFQDDDGVDASWTNGFAKLAEDTESIGFPDVHVVGGAKVLTADGSESTELQYGTPPSADFRFGFMVMFRDQMAAAAPSQFPSFMALTGIGK